MRTRIGLPLLGLTVVLLLQSCGSTHPEVTRFYKAHRKGKGITNITIPKWMIWVGGGLAYNAVGGNEAEAFMPLLRKVNKLRVLLSEDKAICTTDEFEAFRVNLVSQGFDEYIRVRDEETRVQVMVNEEKGRLKDILVLFLDGEESGMVAVRTKIKPKDLAKAIDKWMRLERGKKPKTDPAKEKKKPSIPQV